MYSEVSLHWNWDAVHANYIISLCSRFYLEIFKLKLDINECIWLTSIEIVIFMSTVQSDSMSTQTCYAQSSNYSASLVYISEMTPMSDNDIDEI